jgi:hypothetical protein
MTTGTSRLVLTLSLLLAGCAEQSWTQPGATVQGFNRTVAWWCETQGGVVWGSTVYVTTEQATRLPECLRAEGWKETRRSPWPWARNVPAPGTPNE